MNPTDEITRINQTEVPASPRAAIAKAKGGAQ